LVLPGENPQDLEQLRAALIDSFQPEDPVEATLVERTVECWHFLGRSLRAQQARLEQQMRQAEYIEQAQEWDQALDLGSRLFFDRQGPPQLYPNRRRSSKHSPTSADVRPGDPDQPARLLHRLESTASGCKWLLERWNELAKNLDAGDWWRSPERFKCVRLLGRQTLDVTTDTEVLQIFLACHVLHREAQSPFHDFFHEIDDGLPVSRDLLLKLTRRLPVERFTPKSKAEARQFLMSLVERATAWLKLLLADHEEFSAGMATGAADQLAFDFSQEGQELRRYETTCDRAFHRALERLRLVRKDRRAHNGSAELTEAEFSDTQNGRPSADPETQDGPAAPPGPAITSADPTLAEPPSRAPKPVPQHAEAACAHGSSAHYPGDLEAEPADSGGLANEAARAEDPEEILRNEASRGCTDRTEIDGPEESNAPAGVPEPADLAQRPTLTHASPAGP
jgi:hypothetical protein